MAPKQVLIVDDSRELGRLLQSALSTLDSHPHVTIVPSAEEALLEASHHPVDLMITDVRLPGISGIELTRRLRSRFKDVKTIQITGMTDPSIETQAREAGADFFFLKPLSMPVFIDAVEKLLGVKAMTAPSPAQAEPEGIPQTDRLVELLSSLRQSLRAEQAALIDDRGRILFQDMEDGFQRPDPELLAVLAESLQASNKVSRILASKDKENVLAFRGRSLDILVSTISAGYNLLLVLQNGRTAVRLAIAFDALLTARKDVQTILVEMGIAQPLPGREGRPARIQTRPLKRSEAGAAVSPAPVEPHLAPSQEAAPPVHDEVITPPEAEAQPEAQDIPAAVQDNPASAAAAGIEPILETANDVSAAEFDALFNPKGETTIAANEASAFWDQAVEKTDRQVKTGGISFEQARQMGITPEDLLGKE